MSSNSGNISYLEGKLGAFSLIRLLLVSIASLTIFLLLSMNRLVAVDEGFYLMAGKLVAEGASPYSDFFYPQMPLLPYLHSTWIYFLGASWITARVITAIFSTILALLIYLFCSRSFGAKWGLLALLLFITNGFILGWFTIAKTYTFSALPLFLSFLFYCRPEARNVSLLLSGILLGITIDIRLFYLGLIPIFLIYGYFYFKHTKKSLLLFCLGILIGVSPNFIFLIQSPDSYWFSNLGYHLARSHRPADLDLWSKVNILSLILGIKSSPRLDGFQYQILFWIGLLGSLFTLLLKRKLPPFSLGIGLSLCVIYFVPNPMHLQYFSTTVPFLLTGMIELLASMEKSDSKRVRTICWYGAFFITALSLLPINQIVERFTESGEGVKGMDRITSKTFTLSSVITLSEVLGARFLNTDKVVAQWPGFLFQTPLKPLPGLENQFWIRVHDKLNLEERIKYHIMSLEQFKRLPFMPGIHGFIIEKRKLRRYSSLALINQVGMKKIYEQQDVVIFEKPAKNPKQDRQET